MQVFKTRFHGADSLKYIFPSKQEAVQKAIEIAALDDKVRRLIVFGSALTMDCGMQSDVDIAIDAPEIDEEAFAKLAKKLYIEVPSEIDVINLNKIQNRLLKDNIQKGVCVYAKQ